MKYFSILLMALSFLFFSCNNKSAKQAEDDTTAEEQLKKTDIEKTEPAAKESKMIVVDEPTTININDIEAGTTVFGLTVTDANIQSEKHFSFTIAEEFILDGFMSEDAVDGGIIFMSGNQTLSNATLQIGDMEKPFFLWTEFNNKEKFLSALGQERIDKAENFEEVPMRVKLKNYKVVADEEAMWIGAFADFIEIVE